MARYGYVTLALATTILTGCGAEEKFIFGAPASDLNSCVTGSWTLVSSSEDGSTLDDRKTIEFKEDGYVYTTTYSYESYLEYLSRLNQSLVSWVLGRGIPDYIAYRVYISVIGWEIREELMIKPSNIYMQFVGVGATYNEALRNAQLELENTTRFTPREDYFNSKGYNIHCEDNFMSLQYLPYLIADVGLTNYTLVSDNPLTYVSNEREYSRLIDGNQTFSKEELLTLNPNGTYSRVLDYMYEDYSQDRTEYYFGTYEYVDEKLQLNPNDGYNGQALSLFDMGTVLSTSKSYLTRTD